LAENGVKIVLIEKLDRLARKLHAQESIVARMRFHKLELISALEPTLIGLEDDSMEAAMREAMRCMMGIFSELERKNIVHKLRGARQRARLKDPSRHEGRNFLDSARVRRKPLPAS